MSMLTKLAIVAARQMMGNAKGAGKSEILRDVAGHARRAGKSDLVRGAVVQAQRVTAARVPELERPARRRDRAVGRLLHVGFILGIVLMMACLFGFLTITSGASWLIWTRFAVGIVLIGEGYLLATDRLKVRSTLLMRFRVRRGETPGSGSFSHSMFWRMFGQGLALMGLIWIVLGSISVALAAAELVPVGG